MITIENAVFEALPEETRKLVEKAIRSFAYGAAVAAHRSEGDTDLLNEMIMMANAMQHTSALGDSSKSMSPGTQCDLRAGIVGARMVLTPGRNLQQPQVESRDRVVDMKRFLEMVECKVGGICEEDNSQFRLLIRLSEDQDLWIIDEPRI